jgi:hypothetical protein
MTQTNETRHAGGAAGLGDNAFPGGNCKSEIAPKAAGTQAEFAASISCRSLRAAALRECLKYESLRIIAVATTASAHLADEDDEGALAAFRRLWQSVKTDIAIPAAELARLSGGGRGAADDRGAAPGMSRSLLK